MVITQMATLLSKLFGRAKSSEKEASEETIELNAEGKKLVGLEALFETLDITPGTHIISKIAEVPKFEEWREKLQPDSSFEHLEINGKDYKDQVAKVTEDFPYPEAILDENGEKPKTEYEITLVEDKKCTQSAKFDEAGVTLTYESKSCPAAAKHLYADTHFPDIKLSPKGGVFVYEFNRWGSPLAVETAGKKPVGWSNKERRYNQLRNEKRTPSEAAFQIALETAQEGLVLPKTHTTSEIFKINGDYFIDLGKVPAIPCDKFMKKLVGTKVKVPSENKVLRKRKFPGLSNEVRVLESQQKVFTGRISEVGKLLREDEDHYAAKVEFNGRTPDLEGLEAYVDKAVINNFDPRVYFTSNTKGFLGVAKEISAYSNSIQARLDANLETMLEDMNKEYSDYRISVPITAPKYLMGICELIKQGKINITGVSSDMVAGVLPVINFDALDEVEISLPKYLDMFWKLNKAGSLQNILTPEMSKKIYFDTLSLIQNFAGEASKHKHDGLYNAYQYIAQKLQSVNETLFLKNSFTKENADKFLDHYNRLRAKSVIAEIDNMCPGYAFALHQDIQEVLPEFDVSAVKFTPYLIKNNLGLRMLYGQNYTLVGSRVLPDGKTEIVEEKLPAELDNFMYALALPQRDGKDYRAGGLIYKQ